MTQAVIALGLATAAAYGASDFLGGLASRQAGAPLAVVALLKLVASAFFLVWIPLAGSAPNAAGAAWGMLAGGAIGLAYIAYFRGLATSHMGIVATIAAVWAAIVPLLAGLILGERPSALAWAGIVMIASSIILITYTRAPSGDVRSTSAGDPGTAHGSPQRVMHGAHTHTSPRARPPAPGLLAAPTPPAPLFAPGVLEGTAAGMGFGMFFVALERASASTHGGALAWPLFLATAVAAIVAGVVAILRRVDWGPAQEQAPAIAAAGILYALGSWAFITAVELGWISIVAVLAALSPVPTILLARLLLRESLIARQLLGAVLAMLGVALVTGGLPA